MPQNRCNDERLLRLSHGEPGLVERWAAAFHLTRCADCRQRQAQLESLAHALRREAGDALLTPERVDAARRRFHARIAGVDAPEPVRAHRSGARAALAVGASLSCVLAAGLGIWRYEHVGEPERHVSTVARAPLASKAAPIPDRPAAAPVVHEAVHGTAIIQPQLQAVAPGDTEVALLRVLHAQGLCRQGSVELIAEPVLTVRGVVGSATEAQALREELERAAGGHPVVIELRSAEEAAVPATPGTAAPPISAATPIGHDLLRDYVQSSRESNRISNEAIRLAGAMTMEAWALRRLDERARSLSAANREALGDMHAEHLAALERALLAEQELLAPIVGTGAMAMAEADLASVTRLADLIQDAFAAPRKATESADAAREALRNGLASALAAVRKHRQP